MTPFRAAKTGPLVVALAVAVAALVAGCAADHPRLTPSSEPGKPTVADARTRPDVLRSIGVFELANGGSPSPMLLGVESLGRSGETWIERWTVSRNGRRVPYSVKLRPGTGERIDFDVEPLATAASR